MTMPFERTNAVLKVRKFLLDLLLPKKTPRVPAAVRREALDLLKHYPTEYDMASAVRSSKKVFDFNPAFNSDFDLLSYNKKLGAKK